MPEIGPAFLPGTGMPDYEVPSMRIVFVCALALTACGALPSASLTSGEPAADGFPTMPDPTLTPGKVCDAPDAYRYPEHIAYCNRDVSTSAKNDVIHTYDVRDGYTVEAMNRQDFKIDHYIPLCMGGSNDATNLWPQHKTVYVHTDPIEDTLCQIMAAGKMKQVDAIDKMEYAKHHLDECAAILDELKAQLGN
jgi:hypothetical protein